MDSEIFYQQAHSAHPYRLQESAASRLSKVAAICLGAACGAGAPMVLVANFAQVG